jgi:hypothetical protein
VTLPLTEAARLLDAARNALAAALLAGVYALLAGGLFHLVPAAPSVRVAAGWVVGAAAALTLFLVFRGAAWLGSRSLPHVLPPRRTSRLAPLVSLVAAAGMAPALLRATDLASLTATSAFLGASLALSTAYGFYDGVRQALVPAQRVRDALAERPAVARWIERHLGLLTGLGALLPWAVVAIGFLLLPPPLRQSLSGYLILLAFLGQHLIRRLTEEVIVWILLHALRAGNLSLAARLPVRAARLSEEIRAAAPDLEAPWAELLTAAGEGLEGVTLSPVELRRMARAFLAAYSSDAATPVSGREIAGTAGLVGRLVARGIRFRLETEGAAELEPLGLPAWSDLLREVWRHESPAWQALAERCPGERRCHAAARLYPVSLRATLLPAALAWAPLMVLSLAWIGRGPWGWPLVAALLSFALLLWLTFFYGNWVFDESLRRRDFPYLARQLAGGTMRGELEDALGSRDPKVRERAVELLLFDDDVARLGITVPPAGLRKFLRRAS